MTKIQLLSDLHLDKSQTDLLTDNADIVLIVGDTTYQDHHWDILFQKLNGKPTIIVPGNHDYDGWDVATRDGQIKELAKDYPNVHYLNNESIVLQGIKFIGSCLWTDLASEYPHMPEKDVLRYISAIGHLNTIRENGKKFTSQNILDLHYKARAYLEYELLKNRPSPSIPVVVATHFAPSKNSVAKNYKLSNNSYHVVDMEALMGFSDVWVHGHVHDSFDYTIEGTRVISNPRGNSPIFGLAQNNFFVKDFTFEISPSLELEASTNNFNNANNIKNIKP